MQTKIFNRIEIKQEELKSVIESLLFIANRPLSKKEIAKITHWKTDKVEQTLKQLSEKYKQEKGGIRIIQNGQEWQMVTDPANSSIIQKFLKQEINQELTPASLETLSIIAYRSPIKRDELEQIRGVNCSIILRNLLIKGLIVQEDKDEEIYNVSLDFIRHLGINDLKELPNYEQLNEQVPLSSLLERTEQ